MATIRTAIELQDNFTNVLYQVINSVNLGLSAMEDLHQSMNSSVDATTIDAARQAIDQATISMQQLEAETQRIDPAIDKNTRGQEQFNKKIHEGISGTDSLMGSIKGAIATYAGIAGVKKAFSFVEDCTESFNTQLNAENQLMTVLGNMLSEDYVSQFEIETTADITAAVNEINAIQNVVDEAVIPISAESRALQAEFDAITKKANEIQGDGIYGDEVMIAGAAEFATYFSDTEAITTMMDTLSDYAMGMSGGGEIDKAAMVDYATGLGKIMTGSYDAMTKKGFEFSDAQKAIIEGTATQEQLVAVLGDDYASMSGEMQAAAAISQVIEESWGGLYETMSNTPEGKIIQLNNAWGDMKEAIGGQLYPFVLLLVDTITENWGTIEGVVSAITTGLEYLVGVLSWVLEGALNVAQYFIDNWSAIAPIITPIAIAVALLAGALFVYKVVMMLAAAAQWLFNTSLLGCPLVWILVIIIAVIAAIFMIVGAINKVTGSSISAIGVIMGALAVAGAFIWDLFLGLLELVLGIINYLVNPILAFVNFFGNIFNDPVGSIIHLFGDLADNILGVIEKIASAMDFVFGSNMADTVQGWRSGLKDMVDTAAKEYGNGQYEEIMSALDLSVEDLGLSRIAYSDAWNAGYELGEEISEFDPSSLFGTTDIPTPEDYINNFAGDINDISDNTEKIADSMEITEEDLKYLRDIAEQETINRFTTAEITIEQTNHNTVSGKLDLDGVVYGLTDAVNEAVDIITEGVHV